MQAIKLLPVACVIAVIYNHIVGTNVHDVVILNGIHKLRVFLMLPCNMYMN